MIDWDGERLTITAANDWARRKLAHMYELLKSNPEATIEFVERDTPTFTLQVTVPAETSRLAEHDPQERAARIVLKTDSPVPPERPALV